MTKEIQEKAAADTALIEAVAAPLPLPEPAEVLPDAGDPAKAAEIQRRMGEIDITSTGSIIGFGSAAQAQLQEISQAMLSDVRNKDVGPAGSSLREIVTTIRGFSLDELDPDRKQSWWDRLTGKAAPVAQFLARYESVRDQIDKITASLDMHELQLLKVIKALDLIY